MAYELNFDIKLDGLSDVQKIEAIVAAIGKQTGLTSAQLGLFEQVLKADVAAGNSLNKSLADLSTSANSVGKEISGAAAAALKASETHAALGATTQKVAAANETARKSFFDLNKEMEGATKGFALGALGLGVVGGIGLQVGRSLASGLVGTIKELTTGFAESSRETERFAERMGLTNSKARELENIAALAGVNVGTLAAASRILANALEDSNGSGKKAATALNELGIATRTLNGGSREEGEVLSELIDKLSKIPDPTERARLAFVTLGRGAKEILPLIDELDELKGRLSALGISYDDDIIKKGAEADKAFKELGLSFKYLKDTLAAGIAPIVIPIVLAISKAISNEVNNKANNRDMYGVVGEDQGARGSFQLRQMQGLLNARGPQVPTQSDIERIALSGGPSVPDVTGAAAAQRQIGATQDGMQARVRELQTELSKQQAIMTDPNVSGSAHQTAAESAAAAQTEITSLEKRIDAIKATGKAAEDAEKLVDRFNAALARISGTGESKMARLESEGRGALYDVSGGGAGSQAQQDAMQSAELKAFMADMSAKLEAERKKLFSKSYFSEDGTINQQKLGDLTDQALINSDKFAKSDYSEQEKQQRERLKELGPNYQQLGNTNYDPFAAIPLQRSRQQLSTTFDQNAQFQEQMVGIQGAGKDPLALQMQIAAIEKSVADQHYADAVAEANQITNESQKRQALFDAQVSHEDELHALQLKNAADVAAYQKQQQEEFAHTFSSGLQALISGKGTEFFRGIGQKLEDTIFTNAGRMIAQSDSFKSVQSSLHIGQPGSLLGNLLEGTPFGADPTKGVAAVTALNTTATQDNTAATAALYSALTGNTVPGVSTPTLTGGSGGLLGPGSGGLFGGGALGNGIYSLASGTIGSDGLPAAGTSLGLGDPSKLYANIFGKAAPSPDYSGLSGFMGGLGHTGDLQGIFTGVSGASNQTLSTSERFGAGVGTAGAFASGALGAVSGFSKGGPKGDLQGIGSILGAAASIPGPQQPFLAAGAMITGLISSLLGDPRQERANQISKELGNAKYQAPEALNETVDTSGNYQDFNQMGGVRTSPFRGTPMVSQPYQWYHNGTFLQYPGEQISPFQNPDLVIPPSVAPNSPYNPEGMSRGGTQVVAPGTGVQQPTIVVQALDSESMGTFFAKPANQAHFADTMSKIISSGKGSQFRDTFARSIGLR